MSTQDIIEGWENGVEPYQPKEFTLQNIISQRICDPEKGWIDWPGKLTETQQAGIVDLLQSHTRQDTRDRLWRAVQDNCRKVKSCGIMERVMLSKHGASYCAGQSYPDEIRTVRQIVIASY